MRDSLFRVLRKGVAKDGLEDKVRCWKVLHQVKVSYIQKNLPVMEISADKN